MSDRRKIIIDCDPGHDDAVAIMLAARNPKIELLGITTVRGNSMIIIEHNLHVIKTADWIIDMGPEGGLHGGEVCATGTPEEVARRNDTPTGKYLKQILGL